MIHDSIGRIGRYSNIPLINDIQTFLKRPDVSSLKDPEIEIRGRDLFVRIMRYHPKPAEQNKFETHQQYADVQVVLKGKEIMQTAPAADLTAATDYDSKSDFQFYKAGKNISQFVVQEGEFAVFYPGEAHRPSCAALDYPGKVLKFVFKIKMGPS